MPLLENRKTIARVHRTGNGGSRGNFRRNGGKRREIHRRYRIRKVVIRALLDVAEVKSKIGLLLQKALLLLKLVERPLPDDIRPPDLRCRVGENSGDRKLVLCGEIGVVIVVHIWGQESGSSAGGKEVWDATGEARRHVSDCG